MKTMRPRHTRDDDPAARRARQRVQAERALIRYVVDHHMVPLSSVRIYLDLPDEEPEAALMRDDTVFPDAVDRHYSILATIYDHVTDPSMEWPPGGYKLRTMGETAESSARRNMFARDLPEVLGDGHVLFELVAELSKDPDAFWNWIITRIDHDDTVH